MTRVYLSLGSNIHRHKHIYAALDALADIFGELLISPVYESRSVGFDGSNFFNLVVGIDTELGVAALSDTLKQIENDNGRVRSGPKFSPRTLDIDILTWGNFVGVEQGVELPRPEITQNAFVLLPLADIAGAERHPQLQQSYTDLWAAYDQASQSLWPVDFVWHEQVLSRTAS